MAYDAARERVMFFGGSGADSGFLFALGDTWTWDGSDWTQMCFQCGVPSRNSHAMAYDSTRSQVVMFGGMGADLKVLNDTWVWDGSKWTQKTSKVNPPARQYHVMAYDSARGQVVLFGGNSASAEKFNDTWIWDGSNWTQKFPSTSPPADSAGAMAYDSSRSRIVLLVDGQTWVWDGSNWTQEFPQIAPPQRPSYAMAYDSKHQQVVLFAGQSTLGFLSSDTWTWSGGALSSGPTIGNVVSATAFGGSTSVAPGSWIEIYGSNLVPDTKGWTAADFANNIAPTSLEGVQVSVGGKAAFVDYVSPTQVDALLPFDIASNGLLDLTVTNGKSTSAKYNIALNPAVPGLLAPPSFRIDGQYVVAQFVDGTYVLPTGAIAGVTSRPAKPGETIVIYGIGFGEVTPSIPAGTIVTQTNQIMADVQISFNDIPAPTTYAGLAPNVVGLYQFNVVVPDVPDNNRVGLTVSVNGVEAQPWVFTAVHH